MERREAARQIRVARQPIYDRTLKVFAYELLYRAGSATPSLNGDQATSAVLGSAFGDMGIEQLVGDRRAFINFTRNFLVSGQIHALPPEIVVVEVLEDIPPDEEVLHALRGLAQQGYLIALDDFVFRTDYTALIDLANIIKVDLTLVQGDELQETVRRLKAWPVHLLAEKVETPEEYDTCKLLGFDYFQGYFFCRPRVVERRRPTANRQALLQLVARLFAPDVTFAELADLSSRDPSLSYRLLRLANSAYFGLPRPVDNLRQAMTFMGIFRIRTWISFLMVAGLDDKPDELLTISLTRARMCEQLARKLGYNDPEGCWTLGILSTLDAFLDMEMSDIVHELPLNGEMNEALLCGSGWRGALLRCAIAQERGEWSVPEDLPLSEAQIQEAWQDAIQWAQTAVQTSF